MKKLEKTTLENESSKINKGELKKIIGGVRKNLILILAALGITITTLTPTNAKADVEDSMYAASSVKDPTTKLDSYGQLSVTLEEGKITNTGGGNGFLNDTKISPTSKVDGNTGIRIGE